MKILLKILCGVSFFIHPLSSSAPAEKNPTWKDKLRVRTLENIDLLLSWGSGKHRLPLSNNQDVFYTSIPELQQFANRYGYFSLYYPLIGHVSASQTDLNLVCTQLELLSTLRLAKEHFQLTLLELLTKALAYRDLKKGQRIQIPIQDAQEIHLETFTVDHVFDIWKGMPAFGLIPEKQNLSSILLFRGTDFSLISKRGIASVMSDLDPSGPGLRAFFHSRKEIQSWLSKVQLQRKPAKVMGFSLGGALAAYTFIYENGYLSDEPSFSICGPGVAPSVIKAYNRLPINRKSLFVSYINSGDLVSQYGTLFGTVYYLYADKTLRPLTAHTTLMCTRVPLYRGYIETTSLPYKKK